LTGTLCGRVGKESKKNKKYFWKGGKRGICLGKRGKTKRGKGVATGNATADPDSMTKAQWERAKAEYLTGKGWKAIADDLSVPMDTLRSRACREGLTKVKAQMQTICTEKKTQSLEALSAIVRSKLAEDAASTIERVNGYDLDGIKDESTREQILGSVAKRSALVFGWSEQGEQASVSINLLGQMPDRAFEISVTNETPDKGI
jgi:hypothetical protein